MKMDRKNQKSITKTANEKVILSMHVIAAETGLS
jgi:hypothetical protein